MHAHAAGSDRSDLQHLRAAHVHRRRPRRQQLRRSGNKSRNKPLAHVALPRSIPAFALPDPEGAASLTRKNLSYFYSNQATTSNH